MPNGSDLAVDFDRVGLTYASGTTALTDVSLTVERGEFVSIVGPSGCGKSTLLRIASGLNTATQGRCDVAVDRVGYVFQDATLLPWRSALRNVALFGELSRPRTPGERQARLAAAQSALDEVGLSGFEDSLPHQLSGGMRMRVSLARSLTVEPDLFLFDEPFGALDEITRDRLNDLVFDLFNKHQFAGMFVTHSVREAVAMSTRVVVMSGRPGRIVDEVAVPFGADRGPELRESPEFAGLVARVSHALREVSAA